MLWLSHGIWIIYVVGHFCLYFNITFWCYIQNYKKKYLQKGDRMVNIRKCCLSFSPFYLWIKFCMVWMWYFLLWGIIFNVDTFLFPLCLLIETLIIKLNYVCVVNLSSTYYFNLAFGKPFRLAYRYLQVFQRKRKSSHPRSNYIRQMM